MSGQFGEKEASLEPEDGGVAIPETTSECQIIPPDSVASYIVSRETQMKSRKDNSKCALSPSCGDNRSAYSSVVGLAWMVYLLCFYPLFIVDSHAFWILS